MRLIAKHPEAYFCSPRQRKQPSLGEIETPRNAVQPDEGSFKIWNVDRNFPTSKPDQRTRHDHWAPTPRQLKTGPAPEPTLRRGIEVSSGSLGRELGWGSVILRSGRRVADFWSGLQTQEKLSPTSSPDAHTPPSDPLQLVHAPRLQREWKSTAVADQLSQPDERQYEQVPAAAERHHLTRWRIQRRQLWHARAFSDRSTNLAQSPRLAPSVKPQVGSTLRSVYSSTKPSLAAE